METAILITIVLANGFLQGNYSRQLFKKLSHNKPNQAVLVQRLGGAALLSAAFLLETPLKVSSELSIPGWAGVLMTSLLVAAIIIFIRMLGLRTNQLIEGHPELEFRQWFPINHFYNAGIKVIYLIPYEYVTRILLWNRLEPLFSITVVFLIISALNSVSHLPKSRNEATGAFIFSILQCAILLTTGSIVALVITHFTVAITADYVSMFSNKKEIS